MFYDNYERLCREAGEKPYSLAVKLGAKNNSVVDQWKRGSVPRQPMLDKIAEHFGITAKELVYGEEKQPAIQSGLSEDEVMLLDLFRSLPKDERQSVLLLLRRAAGRK